MIRVPRRLSFQWVLLVVLLLIFSKTYAQETGTTTGTVTDQATGEALIGVNIQVESTTYGTATDLEGAYRLGALQPSIYTFVFSYIGYQKKEVTGVQVAAGSTTTVNVELASRSAEMEAVTVEARALHNSEVILLKDRQKAAAVSNAISAEAMSQMGTSTASEALKKVTGASVTDGKYVQIRGLGGRYINTELNGASLPMADPDKKSVPLDLFPAGLLDNIVTTKTFTPDKPGNFTGGSINIGTKAYPESFTLSLSSSAAYNSAVGLGDKFLSYRGGRPGWLGMNGTAHRLPDELTGPGASVPSISEAWTDPEKAQKLDRLSKAFGSVMAPSFRLAPVNQSYKGSLGGKTSFLGRPLGVITSLSYSRSSSGYHNGTTARYELTGKVSDVDGLKTNYRFTDVSGTDKVLWGGMAALNYKLHPQHTLGANLMYNRGASSRARYQHGWFPKDLSDEAVYETRTLKYTKRKVNSWQLRGKHRLGSQKGALLRWNSTLAATEQNEPDLRFFTNNYTVVDRSDRQDTVYTIRPSVYPMPARYFRNLQEKSWSSEASLKVPFRQWNGLPGQLKMGGRYSNKNRQFRERRFRFQQDLASYNGNPASFFSSENTGLLEEQSTEEMARFGSYVQDATQPSSSYDGQQTVAAAYVMADLPLAKKLRLIGGVRFESTLMRTVSHDASIAEGRLETYDWLPSANLVYGLADNMNLRGAYGRTLARPNFRELAPYASFNFVGDYTFIGNPALKRTLVDNYDLRWEWFVRPGEIMAVSGFYKRFCHPIERVILNTNGEIQYRNVDHARLYGLEIEVRKQLDQVAAALQHLQLGANLTVTRSATDIASSELEVARAFDPKAPTTRPLQEQSPYVLNVDLTYHNPESGTNLGAYYHVFGPRQVEVSMGGAPDLYEQSRQMIDVNFSQQLWAGFKLSASVSNLLGEAHEVAHTFKDKTYTSVSYPKGRSASVGISYEF